MAAWSRVPARSSCTDCGSWRWGAGQGGGIRAVSSELGMGVFGYGGPSSQPPLPGWSRALRSPLPALNSLGQVPGQEACTGQGCPNPEGLASLHHFSPTFMPLWR